MQAVGDKAKWRHVVPRLANSELSSDYAGFMCLNHKLRTLPRPSNVVPFWVCYIFGLGLLLGLPTRYYTGGSNAVLKKG